jgi:endonuclease/exonuclease/phosphatase family metal-dependent hydrolase
MTAVIRVATANLLEGGLDRGGAADRWALAVAALAAWRPHVACVQEMATFRDPQWLWRHLWATANALGMWPVLGPDGGESGNHTAIFVDTVMTAIADQGPPPGSRSQDWCEVLLQIRPAGTLVRIYNVHLPPGSAAEQLPIAQRLASIIARRGEVAVAAGDWNCWAPADQVTTAALVGMPAHLRAARMHMSDGEPAAVNYAVHDTLTGAGLVDAVAGLGADRRDPPQLRSTGINGGGRVDRFYVTSELWDAGAVLSAAQQDSGGASDHEFSLLTIGLAELARADAPGTQQ